jgi:cellobiose phosphorylase
MQYGHFDDERKEYVITRPDTPRSWSNYLGSTEYGAIITQNAGGYSFFNSAAQGRFTRLRFNAVPNDQPGRYLYLHDRDSKDFWSASWQPVGKPLEKFKSECRHGTAYTIISSEYGSIRTETTYFVPLDRHFECWLVKLTNKGKKKRRFSLFTYLEYANNWNAQDDLNNLQYSQFIVKMTASGNMIDHGTNVFMPPMPDNFQEKDQGRHTFMALVGAPVSGYDTDRDIFLGSYGSYSNPAAVVRGQCFGSLAEGDNACGSLQTDLELDPGESKELLVLVGIGEAAKEGRKASEEFSDIRKAHEEFDRLMDYWHTRLRGMTAETPDPEFNSMMGMWSPFNCLITYAWSRAASLVYAGERDGLGYRDTVQDLLGVIHMIPSEAKARLELMLTGQVSTGGAMPVVKQFAHKPGSEPAPREDEYRSDDSLWLFNTIPAYVKETGDLAFYDKTLPYSDKGQDTVLGHMRRAIEFTLERRGSHGLPCGLRADWNDCLQLGQKGESVMVAFQLRYALEVYAEVSRLLKRPVEAEWAEKQLEDFDQIIERYCWDGEWYIRAFRHDGLKFGSKESKEGSIFLNTQSWAVLSGHAKGNRAEKVMESVLKHLATEFGLMLCDPPFEKTDFTVIKATLFNKGMKENGSIFSHTQGWGIIAETLLGHGDRAFKYFRSYMPSAYNTRSEVRQIEPYVYCQFTVSPYGQRRGASRLPWLSGSATWSYYTAAQYILGIRPEYNGIRIDPCIPAAWKGFSVRRIFRGKILDIRVENPSGVQKGVKSLTVNGKDFAGGFIPAEALESQNEIDVVMG